MSAGIRLPMKITPLLRPGFLLLVAPLTLGAAVLLHDDFSSAKHPQRTIPEARGVWKLADGMATSAHNDELFAKNKNHGAVIWFDVKLTDGVVRYSFRADKCQSVAFTFNGPQGHAFRYKHNAEGLVVLAWETHGPGTRAKPIQREGEKGPPLADGQWTDVELRFSGDTCTLAIGDYRRTYTNPGIAIGRSRFGIHYDRGTFSVRDVKVESLAKTTP